MEVMVRGNLSLAEIIPDLIEIGVDALNLQIFCMDIEELVNRYHHKVAFWGEIDRQYTQVFGTEEDMQKAVRRFSRPVFVHDERT
jgi:uroporphyrinogen decarboxylase